MSILVVNAGSSSIKTVVYQTTPTDVERVLECSALNIGQEHATITTVDNRDERTTTAIALTDHSAALDAILERISNHMDIADVKSVGYRVVYGGSKYFEPTSITDSVLADLSAFKEVDPEHAPISHAIMTSLRDRLQNAEHIACFDTGFFRNIPEVAQIIPIPSQLRSANLRRFGYHGLSYEYLANRFGVIAGNEAKNGRVIYAHLGSGASMAATVNGEPVDMTMGLTPTSGLVMGSRSGDVDPSLAWVLAHETGMSIDEYQQIINHESGLLAVSELSSDMYTLLQNQAANPRAALAVELFCYQARKAIGALAATIGGLDSLVFSGGMGEQAPEIRRRICDGLSFLGVSISHDANERHNELISSSESRVGVHVIPTDESLSIARSVVLMDALSTKGVE
jgi:acetate kinase